MVVTATRPVGKSGLQATVFGGRVVAGNAGVGEGSEVVVAGYLLDAVQQQRRLGVVGDHPTQFQQPQQLRQLARLVLWVIAQQGDHRRVVGVAAGIVGFDRLVVAEGHTAGFRVAPVCGGHPTVAGGDDAGMGTIVDA